MCRKKSLSLFLFLIANAIESLALAQSPKVSFARCTDFGVDIAVAEQTDFIRLHLHTVARECSGRTAFVRLRCVEKEGGTTHLSERQFPVKRSTEVWSVYLDSPRFTDRQATYQVEIGTIAEDISEISHDGKNVALDSHVINDSFAWVISNGEINPYQRDGTTARNVYVFPKVVAFRETGAYFVNVAPRASAKRVELRYAVVELPQPVDGARSARRLQSED
ncbi:MAG: hypothetical protein WEB58_00790 [Planctomycetaceae bacterium]